MDSAVTVLLAVLAVTAQIPASLDFPPEPESPEIFHAVRSGLKLDNIDPNIAPLGRLGLARRCHY